MGWGMDGWVDQRAIVCGRGGGKRRKEGLVGEWIARQMDGYMGALMCG